MPILAAVFVLFCLLLAIYYAVNRVNRGLELQAKKVPLKAPMKA